jgi:hypothetical protein
MSELATAASRRANCAILRKALEEERRAGVSSTLLNPSIQLDVKEEVFEITEKAKELLK